MHFEEAYVSTVSEKRAEVELKKHGFTLEEFQAKVGKKEFYKGWEVLDWLGY